MALRPVKFDCTDTQRRQVFNRFGSRGGAIALQDRADAGDQFARAERFGHIVIGAQFQTDDPVDLVIACRQKQDRHFRRAAQVPADIQPVHFRQADVQNDQGRIA